MVGSVNGGELREGDRAIFLSVSQTGLHGCRFDSRPRHALFLQSLIYKGFVDDFSVNGGPWSNWTDPPVLVRIKLK
jgi:hypothetical protein